MNLFISFSGGESSAFMLHELWFKHRHQWPEIIVLFANTGQENEETLRFVHHIETAWGIPIVWLEAKVDPAWGSGTSFTIVDYNTASRNGEPFEEVIKKYGIPNKAYPHCTRELKQQPMYKYLDSLGWKRGGYRIAIGIRSDEADRMSGRTISAGGIYPLVKWDISKEDVNRFWHHQPFRLQLKGYEGNCKWCWKKSTRKHYTLLNERPEIYDFPERMESLYPLSGHNVDGAPRVFFRGNKSTKQLRWEASTIHFTPAGDDSIYDPELDTAGDCSESCEVEFFLK